MRCTRVSTMQPSFQPRRISPHSLQVYPVCVHAFVDVLRRCAETQVVEHAAPPGLTIHAEGVRNITFHALVSVESAVSPPLAVETQAWDSSAEARSTMAGGLLPIFLCLNGCLSCVGARVLPDEVPAIVDLLAVSCGRRRPHELE